MDQIIAQAISAGPMGLFVAYLIWERRNEREERVSRVESDKALAASLAALTIVIQGLPREERK